MRKKKRERVCVKRGKRRARKKVKEKNQIFFCFSRQNRRRAERNIPPTNPKSFTFLLSLFLSILSFSYSLFLCLSFFVSFRPYFFLLSRFSPRFFSFSFFLLSDAHSLLFPHFSHYFSISHLCVFYHTYPQLFGLSCTLAYIHTFRVKSTSLF